MYSLILGAALVTAPTSPDFHLLHRTGCSGVAVQRAGCAGSVAIRTGCVGTAQITRQRTITVTRHVQSAGCVGTVAKPVVAAIPAPVPAPVAVAAPVPPPVAVTPPKPMEGPGVVWIAPRQPVASFTSATAERVRTIFGGIRGRVCQNGSCGR